ncbi:MAG TPA: hypothetical protein VKA19_09345 [Alphaproteobacteria bacterium]|nr:hypothetical protein [Alphaproteobacteria bacterium]
MIVARKINRTILWNFILGWMPDLAISWAATAYLHGEFITFILVLVGLQAVYFAVWVKKSLWAWFLYWFRDKKVLTRSALDYLVENKFPKPDSYLADAEEYYGAVIEDEAVATKIRLEAAMALGTLNALKMPGGPQTYLRISIAVDNAIEQYGRKLNERETGTP